MNRDELKISLSSEEQGDWYMPQIQEKAFIVSLQ